MKLTWRLVASGAVFVAVSLVSFLSLRIGLPALEKVTETLARVVTTQERAEMRDEIFQQELLRLRSDVDGHEVRLDDHHDALLTNGIKLGG